MKIAVYSDIRRRAIKDDDNIIKQQHKQKPGCYKGEKIPPNDIDTFNTYKKRNNKRLSINTLRCHGIELLSVAWQPIAPLPCCSFIFGL